MLLRRNSDPCVPTFWKQGMKQREKMDGWMKCIQSLAGSSAGSSGGARESTSAIHHHHLWAQQYEMVWNKLQVNRLSASYFCVFGGFVRLCCNAGLQTQNQRMMRNKPQTPLHSHCGEMFYPIPFLNSFLVRVGNWNDITFKFPFYKLCFAFMLDSCCVYLSCFWSYLSLHLWLSLTHKN